MNNETHTPEPWYEIDGRIYSREPRAENDEVLICDVAPDNDGLTEFDGANARRIVACVNAAAGVSTEFLESGASLDRVQKLIEQRDELAEALRRCLSHFENIRAADADDTPMMAQARAALAKLK